MLNKVEICGVNTSKLPVIPHKKAKELFVLIKKGDKAASKLRFRKLPVQVKRATEVNGASDARVGRRRVLI